MEHKSVQLIQSNGDLFKFSLFIIIPIDTRQYVWLDHWTRTLQSTELLPNYWSIEFLIGGVISQSLFFFLSLYQKHVLSDKDVI